MRRIIIFVAILICTDQVLSVDQGSVSDVHNRWKTLRTFVSDGNQALFNSKNKLPENTRLTARQQERFKDEVKLDTFAARQNRNGELFVAANTKSRDPTQYNNKNKMFGTTNFGIEPKNHFDILKVHRSNPDLRDKPLHIIETKTKATNQFENAKPHAEMKLQVDRNQNSFSLKPKRQSTIIASKPACALCSRQLSTHDIPHNSQGGLPANRITNWDSPSIIGQGGLTKTSYPAFSDRRVTWHGTPSNTQKASSTGNLLSSKMSSHSPNPGRRNSWSGYPVDGQPTVSKLELGVGRRQSIPDSGTKTLANVPLSRRNSVGSFPPITNSGGFPTISNSKWSSMPSLASSSNSNSAGAHRTLALNKLTAKSTTGDGPKLSNSSPPGRRNSIASSKPSTSLSSNSGSTSSSSANNGRNTISGPVSKPNTNSGLSSRRSSISTPKRSAGNR